VVGYGTGGPAALAAAIRHTLGAAVTVAPRWRLGSGTPNASLAAQLRTPWLGLIAENDADAAPGPLEALADAMSKYSPVYTRLVVYPGYSGPVHHDRGDTAGHAAAFDSWQRTLEWLELRVVPRPTPLAQAWLDQSG
jgi:carboxymethylenebutenolidase